MADYQYVTSGKIAKLLKYDEYLGLSVSCQLECTHSDGMVNADLSETIPMSECYIYVMHLVP